MPPSPAVAEPPPAAVSPAARRRLSRPLAIVALAVLALAVVAALAPASLARLAVERASDGAWTIADARGSLWSGTGRLADREGRASVALAWRIGIAGLLTGAPRIELGDQASPLRGQLTFGTNALEVAALDATVPASFAMAFVPRLVPLSAGGVIRATSEGLMLAAVPQGAARLAWNGARLADARGRTLELGEVLAAVVAREGALVATLSNRGGEAALSGEVRIGAARAEGAIVVSPRDGAAPPLLASLAPFGQPDGRGGLRFVIGAP